MADVAVVILTKNEEIHLARALISVKCFAKEVHVVDSYSTDKTCDIAREHGAMVYQNPFVNQAKQFQWAMDNIPIKSAWIMRLDADEIIESDLSDEIEKKLQIFPSDVVGINLVRKHIFLGRWVRFGGRYPLRLLRIWRKGHGRVEDRWMDEHVVVSGGRTVTLSGGFADWNLNDLTYFVDKHNKYATREALEIINSKRCLFLRDEIMSAGSASFQAAFKRTVKEKLYNKIPFTLAALSYFLWRYVIQLGFLDGRSGLVYHFLQGYWYRFLVGAKVMELEGAISEIQDKDEVLVKLSELTGFNLVGR
jgi:glycosyltransferase involved in cell wall biosynthesis